MSLPASPPSDSAGHEAARLAFGDLCQRAARHALHIDGRWVTGRSDRPITTRNPATGEALVTLGAASQADIDDAVRAARRALTEGPWSRMPAAERAACLHRLADLLEAHRDELALIECLDGGNPMRSLRGFDVPHAVATTRDHAGWAGKLSGEVPLAPLAGAGFAYTMREPVGVVAAITPWNAALLMAVRKLTSALAAGCTCVLKPAELAPLSTLRLVELCEQAGLPPGVVNLVPGHGDEAGRALSHHPDVNLVTFTGSTRVGREILAASGASNLKRMVLELGGKSPVVVLRDADLERAATAVVQEIAFKSGQYCAAGTRLIVEQAVYDDFNALLLQQLKALRVGDGLREDVDLGPLISQPQRERVHGYVAQGIAAGAELLLDGRDAPGPGYFFRPTLFGRARGDMAIVRDEIFGPVLSAMPVAGDDIVQAAAALANDSSYGLAAKVWSRDLARVHRLVRQLQAGSVIVNGGGGEGPLPTGGYKQSGFGRETGHEGMLAFTELKTVRIGY